MNLPEGNTLKPRAVDLDSLPNGSTIYLSVGHDACFKRVPDHLWAYETCIAGPSVRCICGQETSYWHRRVKNPARVAKESKVQLDDLKGDATRRTLVLEERLKKATAAAGGQP